MRSTRLTLSFSLLPICLALAAQPALATLIGGSVDVSQAYDTGSGLTLISGFPITVGPIVPGNSDETFVGGTLDFPHLIDFEAFSYTLFITSTGWGVPFVFNGIYINNFIWQGGDRIITGVTVTDNHPIFGPADVTFTDDEIFMNFAGLSTNGTSITVDILTQISCILGDTDGDSDVDFDDFLSVNNFFGDPGPSSPGDADCDGDCDFDDFLAVNNFFGTPAPGSALASASILPGIPEPASATLLLLAICPVLHRRKPKSH